MIHPPSLSLDKSGQPSFGLSVGVTSGLVNGCPLLSSVIGTLHNVLTDQCQPRFAAFCTTGSLHSSPASSIFFIYVF